MTLRWRLLVLVLVVTAGATAFGVYSRNQAPPRLLKLVPNPLETTEITPYVRGEAVFSVPMDTLTVEYGIRFTEITGTGLKGPYLLKDYVDFKWSDGGRRVVFRIKPEYQPAVGSAFFVEVAGLRGRNRKMLQPASFSGTFKVVDLMTRTHWSPDDMREVFRRLREGDY
ncbi:MAG: hypothetical protein V2G42_01450 [bacterium JZ-2024 1]